MKTRAVRSYDSLPRSRDIALDLPLYSPLLGGGRVLDRSRYRNNGVINGATWSSPYRYFDGVDDYIEAPHSASLSPTDAITLISWI